MAKTQLACPAATVRSILSQTQDPPVAHLLPEATSSGNATLCGSLAGLSPRLKRTYGSASRSSALRSGLDVLSRDAQARQPTETLATSCGCADVPTRLKARLGRFACWAPSNKGVFEKGLRARFVQDKEILETLFNGDELGRRGVCAGLAAIWMNLHCAVPDAKISTRMLTLASREGMHHALIYQRLYSLNHDCSTQDLFDPELIGSEAYRQVNEESLRSIDSIESEAHDQIDAIYGISRDNLPLKSTISASKMAGAMATIDGYASLNYRRIHSDKTCSGHEMSMYRSSGNGIITFFEPNYGEFKFRTEAAAQFLRELRERARDENDTYFKWTLTRVRPNIAGMSTPVDVLVDRIKARYAARLVP